MSLKAGLANPYQVQFVRNNMESMTLKEMGALMGKSIMDVHRIVKCIREGYYDGVEPPREPEKPQKFTRPPAVYNNRSHEDVINYWLSIEI
jgi:hypothetical protein